MGFITPWYACTNITHYVLLRHSTRQPNSHFIWSILSRRGGDHAYKRGYECRALQYLHSSSGYNEFAHWQYHSLFTKSDIADVVNIISTFLFEGEPPKGQTEEQTEISFAVRADIVCTKNSLCSTETDRNDEVVALFMKSAEEELVKVGDKVWMHGPESNPTLSPLDINPWVSL